jgi:hypothetical protein
MRAARVGLSIETGRGQAGEGGTRQSPTDCPPSMKIKLQDLELEMDHQSPQAPQSAQAAQAEAEAAPALDSGIFGISAVTSARGAVPVPVPSLELDPVTLVVYEWHNVQPGVLAWVFPSLTAAVAAARTMTNAVKWAILRGQRTVKATLDVEAERARGVVLLEAV